RQVKLPTMSTCITLSDVPHPPSLSLVPSGAGLSYCPDECKETQPHAHLLVTFTCRCGGYRGSWAITCTLTDGTTLPNVHADGVTESLHEPTCATCRHIASTRPSKLDIPYLPG